ncbi:MAG TPA: arylsulfatase [Humisphaera sp.]
MRTATIGRLLLAVVLGPALAGTARAADAAKPRPNVVFVLFDDMGYGQPKAYRDGTEFRTPNIDRVAREGMRFTDAHSAASVCTPTRYGILTGRYPSRIGQFGVLTTYSPPIIPPTRLTVATLMRQSGYDTACIGKWHLGMDWGGKPGTEKTIPVGTPLKVSPNAAGFDYFFGFTHARNIGTVIEQDRVAANLEEVQVQPRLAAKVVEYLDDPKRKEKPFFLYLPLCPPHTPIVPAPEFAGAGGVKGKEAEYGDWLYQGDWVLGRVLETLDKRGLAENTLLIVTSDNGAAGRSYAPLRGQKTSIYEGGHREPFVARWPGRVKAGSVCDDTVCLNDLIATCAEIVGAKLPDDAAEDSVSILPDLLGTAKGPVREATVHQSPGRDLAIRRGPWKLVFLKGGGRELYNLQTDLSESKDVAGANPEVVKELTVLMRKYVADGRSTPGAPQRNDAAIPLDGEAKGKGKKGAKDPADETDQALDPDFD